MYSLLPGSPALTKKKIQVKRKYFSISDDADSSTSDSSTSDSSDIHEDSKSPVYEIPKGPYSGERILVILLNPNIKKRKICSARPCNISKSSKYVVDLERLKHPDDIKKDDFGKWNYSGSHLVPYAGFQSGNKLDFECLHKESPKTLLLHLLIHLPPSNGQ